MKTIVESPAHALRRYFGPLVARHAIRAATAQDKEQGGATISEYVDMETREQELAEHARKTGA